VRQLDAPPADHILAELHHQRALSVGMRTINIKRKRRTDTLSAARHRQHYAEGVCHERRISCSDRRSLWGRAIAGSAFVAAIVVTITVFAAGPPAPNVSINSTSQNSADVGAFPYGSPPVTQQPFTGTGSYQLSASMTSACTAAISIPALQVSCRHSRCC